VPAVLTLSINSDRRVGVCGDEVGEERDLRSIIQVSARINEEVVPIGVQPESEFVFVLVASPKGATIECHIEIAVGCPLPDEGDAGIWVGFEPEGVR
jgi:hypothetical protein